jgi:hypothetical protein
VARRRKINRRGAEALRSEEEEEEETKAGGGLHGLKDYMD